jgi:hypothetical protein
LQVFPHVLHRSSSADFDEPLERGRLRYLT